LIKIDQQQPSIWLVIALSLIFGAIGAYLSKYLGKRGETAATKADFDEILQQLKKTTEISEQVRSAVSHADWVMREWKTIRRIKLEELVYSAISVDSWLDQHMIAYHGIVFELSPDSFPDERSKNMEIRSSPSPAVKSAMIAKLYFSDLQSSLPEICNELLLESINTQYLFAEASRASFKDRKLADLEQFNWSQKHSIILRCIRDVQDEAAKLMNELCCPTSSLVSESI
jgi:hypothetical protein